jgi:BolA protein
MSPLARHRAVYAALGGMMDSDIHALVIRAREPLEAS